LIGLLPYVGGDVAHLRQDVCGYYSERLGLSLIASFGRD
jgi:hypothetical protein